MNSTDGVQKPEIRVSTINVGSALYYVWAEKRALITDVAVFSMLTTVLVYLSRQSRNLWAHPVLVARKNMLIYALTVPVEIIMKFIIYAFN